MHKNTLIIKNEPRIRRKPWTFPATEEGDGKVRGEVGFSTKTREFLPSTRQVMKSRGNIFS
jgi:hypothetical protein